MLVRALRFVAGDLSWLLDNAAVYDGLDLTQLPATTAQPALVLQPLLTTLLLIKLARLWIAAPPLVRDPDALRRDRRRQSGSLADAAAAQTALATITGWPLERHRPRSPTQLGLAFPADYTSRRRTTRCPDA